MSSNTLLDSLEYTEPRRSACALNLVLLLLLLLLWVLVPVLILRDADHEPLREEFCFANCSGGMSVGPPAPRSEKC